MGRKTSWLWVVLLVVGQMHGLTWLWHHQTDAAHCLSQFTQVGCDTPAHHHLNLSVTTDPGCDHGPESAGDDSEHRHTDAGDHSPSHSGGHSGGDDDCGVCHQMAGARGGVDVTVTVVRFYLPFVGSFGDEPELVICQSVDFSYSVRGPPVA